MTPINLMVRRILFLILPLFFLTFVFPVLNPATIAQSDTTEELVTVVLNDFYVHPNTSQAKAGRLTLKAMNAGPSTHELVILKTDLHPAALPRKEAKPHRGIFTEYLVNEENTLMETIDEIEEFPAGTSQTKTVVLDPGHYVLFCNIPGHYDKGMYASLHIVKQ